jgi:antitoxin PrlF
MTLCSRLTQQFQVTIPAEVLAFLNLKKGDRVVFQIEEGRVFLRKVSPADDLELKFLQTTLIEWSSAADDEAFCDL